MIYNKYDWWYCLPPPSLPPFPPPFPSLPLPSPSNDRDEDAPKTIPDPDAVKPELWLDEGPETIPDPDASIPDDWSVTVCQLKVLSMLFPIN